MPTQSEDLQAPEEASQEEPSRSAIWKILINIQANVAKILNENQELRKDIENLKESIQFSDEQVAIVKKVNEELVQKNNALEKEVYDLGQRVQNLEFDHDALEQYTRKFNIEVHGIPECEGENLADIIIKIGQKISVNIITQDIDIVHRLRKKTPTTKFGLKYNHSYTCWIACQYIVGVLCERFERSQNLVIFRSPSNVLTLLSHCALLSVLLNFVSVILYRENLANPLNYSYKLSAIFNILLGRWLAPLVLFLASLCSPLCTIYTYNAS